MVTVLDNWAYGDYGDNWDDEILRRRVMEVITPESSLLDYGAGRGNVAQMNFKGHARFVAGIDPEPEVLSNPFLDEAKILDLENSLIDYPDESFDMVVSDNVLEHVAAPDIVYSEIFRVLKPGGRFIAKTPNQWHYMPMIARSTPTAFHRFYNGLRGRSEVDTFRTVYKSNDVATVRRLAASVGLAVVSIDTMEGRPEYLRLSVPTYLVGMAYERLVNSSELFRHLRCVLLIDLLKPNNPS